MPTEQRDTFILMPVYGMLSTLELESLRDRGSNFTILRVSRMATLIESDLKNAIALGEKLGGFYKVARNCGNSVGELLECISVPDEPKFNWTVSSYGVTSEQVEEAKLAVKDFLKSRRLSKCKYLQPDIDVFVDKTGNKQSNRIQELKLKSLYKNVLHPEGRTPAGLDVVLVDGLGPSPTFGQTVGSSDVMGFERRDISRSYQDPTVTIPPRLARVLVNVGMNKEAGRLLDPFCGLGTILQEGVLMGHSVVGIDISGKNIERSKTNLNWTKKTYGVSNRIEIRFSRADALALERGNLPKIDGIASEPILLPKFKQNPTSEEAFEATLRVKALYSKLLCVLRTLLENDSRISLVSPTIVDHRGREHRVDLGQILKEAGFSNYSPVSSGMNIEYPLRISTAKRKRVQRDIYVMVAR